MPDQGQKNQPRFVVWTSSWNEAVGGVIALHTLCARLNANGIPAALWPDYKPVRGNMPLWRYIVRLAAYEIRGKRRFDTGPFASSISNARDLKNAIVVYPEIVSGNPLRSGKVVRWFLHRPGHHTGVIDYGRDDLHFFYAPAFNDRSINEDAENMLRVTYVNPVYRQTNFGERTESCYIVRKGKDRILDKHPQDATQIDDLSHEEKAATFNRCRIVYSYDAYTMYTFYAAICGCVAVYFPETDVSLESWSGGQRPPGLAYGEDDLDWAIRTRPELLEGLERDLLDEDEMIKRFARTCALRFPSRS